MKSSRWLIGMLLIAGLALAGCRATEEMAVDEEGGPAKVEHLDGAEPTRVTLTEEASKRLDVQTGTVRDMEVDGKTRRVIPYAAVLYDTEGNTWTYTCPEARVFVRHRIVVDYIDGELAILSEGPPPGTAVVIVGAEELYGSELEFEEE